MCFTVSCFSYFLFCSLKPNAVFHPAEGGVTHSQETEQQSVPQAAFTHDKQMWLQSDILLKRNRCFLGNMGCKQTKQRSTQTLIICIICYFHTIFKLHSCRNTVHLTVIIFQCNFHLKAQIQIFKTSFSSHCDHMESSMFFSSSNW